MRSKRTSHRGIPELMDAEFHIPGLPTNAEFATQFTELDQLFFTDAELADAELADAEFAEALAKMDTEFPEFSAEECDLMFASWPQAAPGCHQEVPTKRRPKGATSTTTPITLRVPHHVVDAYKVLSQSSGGGYQTIMVAQLRLGLEGPKRPRKRDHSLV